VKRIITIVLVFIPLIIWCQPPCPPFTPCWCADHPTHPACRDIGIPISDWYGHMILLVLVTLLIYLQIKKIKKYEK